MKKSIIAITAFSMAAAFGHAQIQSNNPTASSSSSQQQRQDQQVRSSTGNDRMESKDDKQTRWGDKDKKDKQHLTRSGSHSVEQVQSDMHQQRLQSSDLVGVKVTDQRDHTIGTISNLEVSERGQIEAAYIDIGGILGIGSTTYRLPFQALQISQDGDNHRVTLQQNTINDLAALSDDLRDSMEEWAEEDAEELAERSEEALDRTAATGVAVVEGTRTGTETLGQRVERGAENAGDSLRRGADSVTQGARRAGEEVGEFGRQVSAEAREIMSDLRGEFQDKPEVAAELTNVSIQVDRQNRLVLDGQVSSEDAKDDILDAAEDISDGREIVDNLRVVGSNRVSADY